MSAFDPTDDLVRAMLDRRAERPMPDWLGGAVRAALAAEPQARARSGWWRSLPPQTQSRLLLAAGLALVLAAIAIGALVASQMVDHPPAPSFPALVVSPSPAAVASASAPAPASTSPEPTRPEPTARPLAPVTVLAPDSIAVVTRAGDGLRVRSAPSVGPNSRKLEPLLPAGSRMLVVRGPVVADGYDWYAVRTSDESPGPGFGWVAAGKDDVPWIGADEPRCSDDLDVETLNRVDSIDRLVCYGDATVPLFATVERSGPDTGIDCEYVVDDSCGGGLGVRPDWFNEPWDLTVKGSEYEGLMITAFAHGTVREMVDRANGEVLALRIGIDDPAARRCRGPASQTRDEAVIECRLRFTVREASPAPEGYFHHPNSQAVVAAAALPVRTRPGTTAGLLAGTLHAGDRVYIDVLHDDVPFVDDTDWYAVLDTGTGTMWGWVPAMLGGAPTMLPRTIACPTMSDWPAFMRLSPTERLTCYDENTQSFRAWVVDAPTNEPYASMGCAAYALGPDVDPNVECRATPSWPSEFKGPTIWRKDDLELGVTFDPTVPRHPVFPTVPTWMKVQGWFAHPDSGECRVTDGTTGEQLLDPSVADIYCRTTFVVSALSSPAP
jgi:hypothetical protein